PGRAIGLLACTAPTVRGRVDVPQRPRRATVGRPRSPARSRHRSGSIWTCAPPLLDRRRPTNVRLFCRTAALPIMGDHGRDLLEFWGIRLVLVALVFALV